MPPKDSGFKKIPDKSTDAEKNKKTAGKQSKGESKAGRGQEGDKPCLP